MRSWCPFLY